MDAPRLVIVALSCLCGLCLAGIVVIEAMGHPSPPVLSTIATLAAGAITGILSPQPHDTAVPTENRRA